MMPKCLGLNFTSEADKSYVALCTFMQLDPAMCGSYGTQRLSWREVAKLARLTTNEPLPAFADQNRYPMSKKAKAVSD